MRDQLRNRISAAIGFDLAQVVRITELDIDSAQGIISASLLLKGESTPVLARLTYRLKGQSLEFQALATDRSWIDAIGSHLLPQTVPIPRMAVALLSLLGSPEEVPGVDAKAEGGG